jgi:hypothetical protein
MVGLGARDLGGLEVAHCDRIALKLAVIAVRRIRATPLASTADPLRSA